VDHRADIDAETLLARFDRTSPDALLKSIVLEFVRLHQSHAMLLSRLAAMEILQATIDRIAADAPEMLAIELPASVEIDATYSLSGDQGFYHLEQGEGIRPFRWTGPDPQFSFEFFVNREIPLRFVLEFARVYADAPPSTIRCYADGHETKGKLTRMRNGFELEGMLPPRVGRGASVVSFVCPVVLSPWEANVSADQRRLGVAFERLKVEPLTLDRTGPDAESVATTAATGAPTATETPAKTVTTAAGVARPADPAAESADTAAPRMSSAESSGAAPEASRHRGRGQRQGKEQPLDRGAIALDD
jgi:hypothetical protein